MSRRIAPVLAVVAVVAFSGGWMASWLATSGLGPARIGLLGDDEGTVTLVNVDGNKFCFTSERDHQERCGSTYSAPALAVGERVELSLVRIPIRDGAANDLYIVLTPPAQ